MGTLSCSFIIQTGFITLFLPHPTIGHPFPFRIYVRIHPRRRPPHFTFYHLSYVVGGGKFVYSCFAAQNRSFFVLLEPRQKWFFREIFFTYNEFVYIYFHLRSSCNVCLCYVSFNVIRFNLPWSKLFQWLSLIWRNKILKNKSMLCLQIRIYDFKNLILKLLETSKLGTQIWNFQTFWTSRHHKHAS